ncbi:MAG TPA: RagB/SusD family nutrient uptake outer membrane protein, partial [Chitinophagaceae bacterium]|nr:RagB/SusD family nutrient uptake outer membrane protein [Chitinophagaceae bacterium]
AANNSRGISYTLVSGADTAVWFADYEVPGAPQFNGTTPFKGFIVTPSTQSNTIYPAVKKFDDPFRTVVNDPSTRPVVIWRFSNVYLLAAEAAFKGGGTLQNAADLINIVRKRAAFRTSYPTGITQASAEAAMMITPAQVTIDFILDECTREFYGEWQRWWDLVRTKKLIDRVKEWNPEAAPYIKDFHVLRPIPQDQIDRVTEGPKFPQNPGY